MGTRRMRLLACGLVALALLASACGEDDEDGDGGSDDTEAASDTTGVSADVLGEPNEATGDPVVIGLITEGGSEAIGSQSELTEQGAQITAGGTWYF